MIRSLFSSWLLQATRTGYVFLKMVDILTMLQLRYRAAAYISGLMCLFLLSMFAIPAQAQTLPNGSYANFTPASGNLFYFTATNSNNEPALWKSDGTRAGTLLVKTIAAANLTFLNGILYFTVGGNQGIDFESYQLWKSDGTAQGTIKLKDVQLNDWVDESTDFYRTPIRLVKTDNLLYFTANNSPSYYDLWRTDGTAAGTLKVTAVTLLNIYPPQPTKFISLGNILYYDSDYISYSWYKTDGTPQGTTGLGDARLITRVNTDIYYYAFYNGPAGDGWYLFKTNGTITTGIPPIKKLDLNLQLLTQSVAVGNSLYFTTKYYNYPSPIVYTLWKSDGTDAGTQQLKTFTNPIESLTAAGNTLYFTASEDGKGRELWKSDGTATGTTLVMDINLNAANANPRQLTAVNNSLYFVVNNGGYDSQLWKTDGTAQDTYSPVHPAIEISNVENLANINGTLFFSGSKDNQSSIWKSDGSYEGTVDIFAVPTGDLSKQWDKTIGGNSTDELSLTIATSDNGYLLAGTSSSGVSGDKTQAGKGNADYWIVKTDASGNKLWDKTFGTANSDILTAAIQTSDGGYLVGGYTDAGIGGDKSQPSQGGIDYWIVKTDASGNKLWDKRFGGTDSDVLGTVLQLSDGNYLLAGKSNSEQGGDKSQNSKVGDDTSFRNYYDPWLVKINSSGTKLWDSTFGQYDEEEFGGVIATSDGGYFITSTRRTSIFDYYFIYEKFDNNGNLQWDGNSGSGGGYDDPARNYVKSAIQTKDGGYLVAGHSSSTASKGGDDYFVVKLSSSGVKQWQKTIGGSANDILSQAIQLTDGGYLLGGFSSSTISGDKTENSAGTDYWLVKITANGMVEWDKTFGGNGGDVLRSLLQTADKGYLLSGTSNSTISIDKSEANRGINDYWILKTKGESLPPVVCSATGSILQEKWLNITGSQISNIPVNTAPGSTSQLSSFETTANTGNNYGERLRGYLCVPTTGSYTFYIAGDDKCELWLSKDENPANKIRIASVPYSSGVREWNKYAAQKSVAITLVAGKKYYIEALHIEVTGNDNVSVAWQTPASAAITVIPGSNLSPYVLQNIGKISREYWANVTGSLVTDIPLTTTPTSVNEITSFETATNAGSNYGQRIRGYLHPQVSGNYTFYIAGDDRCELWLSTDDTPAKKVKIASVPYFTGVREWSKYPSQKSVSISLVAGRKYYIEALHKEGLYSDNLAVGWQTPTDAVITVIAGGYLSPFLPASTTTVARVGVEESLASKVSLYPNPFESTLTLGSSQLSKLFISVVDNLGRVVHQTTAQAIGRETILELAHLKAGVYMIKISTEEGVTQVIRVVKK